jgi:hypothetical protein
MGFLLHVGATVICTHGGQASPAGGYARVRLSGQPAVTLQQSYSIAGCPFATPEPAPKPCASVQWQKVALRVRMGGAPAILSDSSGITIGPMGTQGTPSAVAQQIRVKGN